MVTNEVIYAGVLGLSAAAAAYLLLSLLVLYWRNKTLSRVILASACLATALWSAVSAYDLVNGTVNSAALQALEVVRNCGWMLLVLSLLYWVPPAQRSSAASILVGLGTCVAALSSFFGAPTAVGQTSNGQLPVIIGDLVLALTGAALVENLFRNSPRSGIWKIKYLCFGAGTLFVYDFFLYSDALLFRRLDPGLLLARGPITLLAAPLLAVYAIRNRTAGPQVTLSRQLAFRSATVVGAGVYLVAMAAAGYYVRQFSGTWTTFLQALFLFGAILLLLLPISSGSFRAYLRVAVEKSFFKYKYDYRQVWLRFIKTISTTDRSDDLPIRVIQAVCDIMDSPDGALWLQRPSGKYEMAASWNLSRWGLAPSEAMIDAGSALALFLAQSGWVINLDEFVNARERYETLASLPTWLPSMSRAWLIIPLIQRERLLGIIIIGRARVPRELTWEDFDLLKTVGRQAASYLAEQETSEALAEAQQFKAFNKRFAFVAHDIKNLASQLSLIVTNAAKHRDNAAFQQDANETLQRSVEKLNRMLHHLQAPPQQAETAKPIALAPLLRDIVATRRDLQPAVYLDVRAERIAVAADQHRLKTVVEHLVQNAVDAVGADGTVQVRLSNVGEMALVEIEDNGPGMDAEFIRDKLFRPFVSTKHSGYGIGVYESREYAVSLGGRLDVESQPGRGTIMRMTFPAAELT
jgi:putative PEP-CTERM system histidine kinase